MEATQMKVLSVFLERVNRIKKIGHGYNRTGGLVSAATKV